MTPCDLPTRARRTYRHLGPDALLKPMSNQGLGTSFGTLLESLPRIFYYILPEHRAIRTENPTHSGIHGRSQNSSTFVIIIATHTSPVFNMVHKRFHTGLPGFQKQLLLERAISLAIKLHCISIEHYFKVLIGPAPTGLPEPH